MDGGIIPQVWQWIIAYGEAHSRGLIVYSPENLGKYQNRDPGTAELNRL